MAISEDKLNDLIGRFVTDFGAAMHAATVVIGDKLGLYAALAERGPITGSDLAQKGRRSDSTRGRLRSGSPRSL